MLHGYQIDTIITAEAIDLSYLSHEQKCKLVFALAKSEAYQMIWLSEYPGKRNTRLFKFLL